MVDFPQSRRRSNNDITEREGRAKYAHQGENSDQMKLRGQKAGRRKRHMGRTEEEKSGRTKQQQRADDEERHER